MKLFFCSPLSFKYGNRILRGSTERTTIHHRMTQTSVKAVIIPNRPKILTVILRFSRVQSRWTRCVLPEVWKTCDKYWRLLASVASSNMFRLANMLTSLENTIIRTGCKKLFKTWTKNTIKGIMCSNGITKLAKSHLMKVSLIVKLADGLGKWKTGSTTYRKLFANPSLLITTLAHKNQSHPVHPNQLSGVDCGANRPFLKLHPVHSPSVAATESESRKDLFFRTGIGWMSQNGVSQLVLGHSEKFKLLWPFGFMTFEEWQT